MQYFIVDMHYCINWMMIYGRSGRKARLRYNILIHAIRRCLPNKKTFRFKYCMYIHLVLKNN